MGLSTWIRDAVSPLISATCPTPKLALFPLFIVIFGLGEASQIAIVIMTVFCTTAITVRVVQARVVNSEYAEIAETGHSAYFEPLDAFNDILGRWLSRLGLA